MRDAGISVCCGGILGMGEGAADRVALLHSDLPDGEPAITALPRTSVNSYSIVRVLSAAIVRTALYDAEYTCVLASREADAAPMLSRVVGRHCESGGPRSPRSRTASSPN
mgnify:CR=1 FL=1